MAGKSARSRSAAGRDSRTFVAAALRMGAIAAKTISPGNVATGHWVRWKCQFGCGCYNSSLMCQPHSPTPERTRAMLDEYSRAILFEALPHKAKPIAAALEREIFLAGHYKALGLGSGPCHLCKTCAFGEGCRHPDQARPSMEACGIDVFATVRKHGFAIEVVRTHGDPQHYFGLVLIE